MLYSLGRAVPSLGPSCWVAPTASVIGRVILKDDTSVWFGATLRGDNELITIGERSNIQDNAVLHVDSGAPLTIGDDVTVGHEAMLHGCTIGNNTLIGMGATVLNHAVVGNNCIVGANSLISEGKIIPDGSLVIGTPGKVVRQLTEEQIAVNKMSAAHYVENAAHYREQLRQVSASDVMPRL
mmetsp:Transcript_2709/g.5663  ORF Transcript_2709/g.5663 Transcript_2709/m.5663 type:complete len:182 (+) Transcript_2709:114-659(+)